MRSSSLLMRTLSGQNVVQGTVGKRAVVVLLGMLASAGIVRAQQATDGAESDRQTIQILLRRVEQLEARVSQLEAAKMPVAATPEPGEASGQAATPPAPPESEPEGKSLHGMAERMDT